MHVQELCACMEERKRKQGEIDWEILPLKLNIISKEMIDWRENQWDVITERGELVTRETGSPSLGS